MRPGGPGRFGKLARRPEVVVNSSVIYLLDLNYTLIANSPPTGKSPPPMKKRIHTECYRQWLVEMLRPHAVILITARPQRWKSATLARINMLTGWQPMDAYFDDGAIRTPPAIKRHILLDIIFPKHGHGVYHAIESNPKTRQMYSRLGISSSWVKSPGTARCNKDLLLKISQGTLNLDVKATINKDFDSL